jgi:ABC-type branched-chain amino acid transport systems, ATPase component
VSLLKIEGLSKSFKALKVLKNVNLSLEENERHIIIGPNGAGKTTLFQCITGMIPMDEGTVFLDGVDVTHLPAHTRVSSGMARTFQKNNLFGKLTIEENIHLAITALKPYRNRLFKALTRYQDLHDEAKELMVQWNLWDKRKQVVSELSYGEQRLLEIVLALASKPRILLLDEPTSGMSPGETANTTKLIQSLPRSTSLLVIEHDMDVVFSIADKITVLHHGEVLISGTPEEIRKDERVKEIYFGGGALTV